MLNRQFSCEKGKSRKVWQVCRRFSHTETPWDPTVVIGSPGIPIDGLLADHRWSTYARRHFSTWPSMDHRWPLIEMKSSKTAYALRKSVHLGLYESENVFLTTSYNINILIKKTKKSASQLILQLWKKTHNKRQKILQKRKQRLKVHRN